jgi:hypothetical protein
MFIKPRHGSMHTGFADFFEPPHGPLYRLYQGVGAVGVVVRATCTESRAGVFRQF